MYEYKIVASYYDVLHPWCYSQEWWYLRAHPEIAEELQDLLRNRLYYPGKDLHWGGSQLSPATN